MKTLLLLLFISITINGNSQDYEKYYALINKAEEQFVTLKDNSCFRWYDDAFKSNVPFIKDPYIASQIAYYLKDSSRFYNYLGLCFSLGMPFTSVDAAVIFRKNLTTAERTRIKAIYDLKYKPKEVDSSAFAKICQYCYQSDSIKLVMGTDYLLNQQFYMSENAARQYILKGFLNKGIYFNEHLIPITSDEQTSIFLKENNKPDPYVGYPPMSNKSEWELRVACPFNILLHSHCFFQENKSLFLEAVKKGYLHPKEYAIMEETSIMWYKKDDNKDEICEAPTAKVCYNILGFDPFKSINIYTRTEEGIAQVEENRKAIYMQRFSIDQQKKKLEADLGFAFFFDFIDRP